LIQNELLQSKKACISKYFTFEEDFSRPAFDSVGRLAAEAVIPYTLTMLEAHKSQFAYYQALKTSLLEDQRYCEQPEATTPEAGLPAAKSLK
jgi:hypothetical protein